jgi:hypothetical protein
MYVCPALLTWITPPHMHIRVDVLLSAGILLIKNVGAPTTHGAVVAGTQGIGVRAPMAAAVAAATVGLASELHMPKGMMLTSGALSIMFAAGVWVRT